MQKYALKITAYAICTNPQNNQKYAVTSRHFWYVGTPLDQVLISYYREKLPEKICICIYIRTLIITITYEFRDQALALKNGTGSVYEEQRT